MLVARLVPVADHDVTAGETWLGRSLMLEFGILGPVQVARDGLELEVGGPKRRALLALLLVAGAG